MPLTTAELVHDQSLGDLLIHRDVVLDGLDAPQRAARTVPTDVLDGKAEDQLFDAMLVASELIANAIQHSSGAVPIGLLLRGYPRLRPGEEAKLLRCRAGKAGSPPGRTGVHLQLPAVRHTLMR
ncbi:hypothetical protein [Streptomyces galilaeus]|uniref:hypothetical protein n=1 Tax=Streptomyces galilaeus TaxID=33899 RepID=UPI001677DDA1|nr:hypothetical protein [Streptomyces galilaeus]GGW76947.1 hypothetical protein GCM10010350_72590 [Streptomyces galilaeus]